LSQMHQTHRTTLFPYTTLFRSSEHSFGIHVAKMAGMPDWVLKRANEVLKTLESTHVNEEISNKTKKITEENLQLSFFQLDDPILDRKSTRLNSSHVKISYAVFC